MVSINMDETSVKLCPAARPGAVAVPRGHSLAGVLKTTQQKASLATRRSAFTLVAFVCDCPALQAELPQIVVANEQPLSARLYKSLCRDR